MRAILVGERMNRDTWRPRCRVGSDAYLRLMLRLGAFRVGRDASRLASLGASWVDSMNLLPPDPQGVSWDAGLALGCVSALRHAFSSYDLCWLAGRRVAAAFGRPWSGLGYGVLGEKGGVTAVVLPHPSGLNRWWNDASRASVLRTTIREAVALVGREAITGVGDV